eukprot:1213224-Pleurochrysis_carterae.AAC.1
MTHAQAAGTAFERHPPSWAAAQSTCLSTDLLPNDRQLIEGVQSLVARARYACDTGIRVCDLRAVWWWWWWGGVTGAIGRGMTAGRHLRVRQR